ncbi:MAG: hypothetical protein KJZ85_14410 [Rhodobacteraceae bacterium]|jgi:alpha-tubulin suppressor-like RCC1 family protein|nr:hypothetical protein [Paracoccaceae bacterium]
MRWQQDGRAGPAVAKRARHRALAVALALAAGLLAGPEAAGAAPLAGENALAGGLWHSCALTATGGIRCWGDNFYGQLGDGSRSRRLAPVAVRRLGADVQAVTAGDYHSCAITGPGGVRCWGRNRDGQLGDGSTEDRLQPVAVLGLDADVRAIAAGGAHVCALDAGGAVFCWGDNASGQLGDGGTDDSPVPVAVAGLPGPAIAIAAGSAHSCALSDAGGIWCWGANADGQLGDGTTRQRLAPVFVRRMTQGVTAIAAGAAHGCGVTADGGVRCWGANSGGQLGDGTRTRRLLAVTVKRLRGGVAALAAGAGHSCARLADGAARCWGRNDHGQLGDGSTDDRTVRVAVKGLRDGLAGIAAGANHGCGLTPTGGLRCWGRGNLGQLGNGGTSGSSRPVRVQGGSFGPH